MMFRLRGGLSRFDFGILHAELFSRARTGTKVAIERYLWVTQAALRRIAGMPPPDALKGLPHGLGAGLGAGFGAGLGKAQDEGREAGGPEASAAGQSFGELEGGGSDCTPPADSIPTEVKLAFFNEMRHAYGRTALMLSGGAALGLYHVGVVKALLEGGLLPRVVSG
eukprot:CAMPEP_0172603474 /NCGR_PEP_ID=MMETSP1068-20121228/23725_1 /TAXON_ID=35684 /ORGANISM="Pseudopedinella elastica, Strain CCMP716" /LENGTH=166 /DNA_ID=CAMNT_0013405227 /DNA_START=14 /DNA_END=511 /DNA_ORIENTATION=+